MNKEHRVHMQNAIQIESLKYPVRLVKVPKSEWPPYKPDPRIKVKEAWRSRHFLVQVCTEKGFERLSICRTTMGDDGDFKDGITWDELQELKKQCGRGDQCAVEIYPPDSEIVNVANMRHLWILKEQPEFMWSGKK